MPRRRTSRWTKKFKNTDVVEADSTTTVEADDPDEKDTPPIETKDERLNVYDFEDEITDLEMKPLLGENRMSSSYTLPTKPAVPKKKKNKNKDSGTSSDEERWLNAIESGTLEEVDDELKKMKPKDPKMMTARQRAIFEKGNDKTAAPSETLLSLPSRYKTKVLTVEDIKKAALKKEMRRQIASEKREENKKLTVEKLLKKQEAKALKAAPTTKQPKSDEPKIIYKNTYDNITLTFPPDYEFPLKAQKDLEPPKPVICGVEGCTNIKRYSCSKTNVPLCSLECYRKNLENLVVS